MAQASSGRSGEFRRPDSGERPRGHTGRHRAGALAVYAAEPAGGGRNLAAAVTVGISMAVVALVPLLLYRRAFLLIVALAVAIGTWELVRAIEHSGAHPPLEPLLVGGVGTVPLVWLTGAQALAIGWVVTVVAVMLWRLPEGPVGYARDVASATLAVSYVPFLAGFVVLLLAPADGGGRVLALLGIVITSDVGGYAAGSFFGKHKMAPSISPGKTWEGTAGSVLLSAVAGTAIIVLSFHGIWWQGAVFGTIVSAAAVVGDLTESLIKRDLGMKDMGTLLPGHGGVMDRFDSILLAAPVAYLLLVWCAPVA